MPSDQPRPVTPAWKKAVKPTERSQSALPNWRKEPAPVGNAAGWWTKRTKLLAGSGLFLVASVVLVAVILLLMPPKPACLVLIGADYLSTRDGNEPSLMIPPNSFGRKSIEALQELTRSDQGAFFWGSGLPRLHGEPVTLQTGIGWDKHLENFKEKTVILYLALHGGVDGKGPYLLPQDGDTLEEKNRLYVDDVLDRLARIDKQKKIVLILDATQMSAHWPLGMLHNNFARAMQDPRISARIDEMKNLVVLCSTDVDQRSWVSEERGKTVFADFVLEGLRGAADRAESGNNNRHVDALELYHYTRKAVKTWVRTNRDALQTPVLLPRGEGGEARARAIDLTVIASYDQPRTPSPAFKAPPDLREAWKACQSLEEQVPHPAVYTPQLWRRYVDSLLRYEQLVRAGDESRLGDVRTELDRLKAKILEARACDERASLQNAVAMPEALGVSVPASWRNGGLENKLKALWNATTEQQRTQRWEQLQQEAGETNQPLLPLKLSGLLVDRAAADPKENLQTAYDLLRPLGLGSNTSQQRSAEVHFMAMLHRYLDPKSRSHPDLLKVVKQALVVRRLAEDAALGVQTERAGRSTLSRVPPYSEYVFPWTQQKVNRADERRRMGEDLLFATDSAHWAEAGEHLEEARKLYESAQDDAAEVRQALHTCHEVLGVLPYYSHWLARRRMPPDGWKPADDTRLKQVEELWNNTHRLAQLLEKPDPKHIHKAVPLSPDDRAPQSLSSLAGSVRKAFDELEKEFREKCQGLLDSSAHQQTWHEIDEALLVPRIPADLRMQLLERARRLSLDFDRQTEDENRRSAAGDEKEEERRNEQRAKDQARRQGRMALAMLGERGFRVVETSERYEDVQNYVARFDKETSWWAPVNRAGEELGRRWKELPDRTQQLTLESRKTKPEQAASLLVDAERLARQVEGAAVRLTSVNPVQEGRFLRLHDLLLWEADHTRSDHWWAEVPGQEPFYYAAGKRFVRDARALVEGKPGGAEQPPGKERLEAVAKREAALKQLGRLDADLIDRSRLDVTSEKTVNLEYRVDAKGWLPPGRPVLWMESDKALRPKGSGDRQVLPTDEKEKVAFAFDVPSEDKPRRVPRVEQARTWLKGFYRGQPIELETPLNLHRWPETIVYHQGVPLQPSLAMRADPALHEQYAPQRGSIAIVLDCTGSMLPGHLHQGYNRKTPCAYHQATDAVKDLLGRLDKGAIVSIFVFGHRTDEERQIPEQNITQIRPPIAWDPDQLKSLMSELEALEPWNPTPLVRAMWKAHREGFLPGRRGFKTMIVLTDGDDDRFAGDTRLHKVHGTDKISEFITKEFDNSGVMINLVGFIHEGIRENEKQNLTKQFKEPIEKLRTRGKFWTVNESRDLITTLRQRMKLKLRFRLETLTGRPVPGLPELDGCWPVSPSINDDYWIPDLEPGRYKIIMQIDRTPEQELYLDTGDFLLVNFTRDLRFERVLHGDDFYKGRFAEEKEDWLLFVHQNQFKKEDRSLQMLLTLENRKDRAPKNGTLQQVWPKQFWLELDPHEKINPVPRLGVRWGDAAGYPAPAWGVDVAEWPLTRGGDGPARPALKAWWNWDDALAGKVNQLECGRGNYQSEFQNRSFNVGPASGDKARVESAEVESRVVETRPGVMEQRSCLVVRASYPTGKSPVWVEPYGLQPEGWEHHFYTAANKYTGIFWTVTEKLAQDRLLALRVFSVDEFKKANQDSRLPEPKVEDFLPASNDRRPPTVPELRDGLK